MTKLRWKPSEYAALSLNEKAIVIAFIQERIDEEKKQNKTISGKSPRRVRR